MSTVVVRTRAECGLQLCRVDWQVSRFVSTASNAARGFLVEITNNTEDRRRATVPPKIVPLSTLAKMSWPGYTRLCCLGRCRSCKGCPQKTGSRRTVSTSPNLLCFVPMGHVGRRLYSTASQLAVARAHLKHFPPKEATARRTGKTFDPETWAALQPPPPSALVAFANRIGLGSILTSPVAIQRTCTHKSFLDLHAKYYPRSAAPPCNANLAAIGNALMGLFASEHLHTSYPHLPTRVLKAAVSAHVGPLTCASVAQEMGAAPLLRWHRQVGQVL